MMIKPSASIRNNYRKVADYCVETGLPVFLTNNGEGELIVMSIQAWEEERQRILVEEALKQIESEENQRYFNVEDVFSEADRIIGKAEGKKI
ncbi:MAG: prevent-host-death protein [Oscillospiraceae bacterium]|nr:prevent-host-death protein [Oscillospiraceae bacterium]